MSIAEAVVNTVLSFGVSFVLNLMVLPLFGFHIVVQDSAYIAVVFAVISAVRYYLVRRLFDFVGHRIGRPQ